MLRTLSQWLPSRKWLILPPVLLGIACVAAFAISRKELPRKDPEEQVLSLPVMDIQTSVLVPWATGFGTAKPARTWEAVTEVKGRVTETHPLLDSGKRIRENDLLLKIDDSDYRLRLAQRNSDVNSMKAKLAELEASVIADQESLKLAKQLLAVANADLARMRQLNRNNAVSQSELDSASGSMLQQSQLVQNLKNSLSLYPSKLASAKAGIAMADSQVAEAQRDIDRTTIKSPFAGVLSGVNLEPGQIVGQNQRLFKIHDDQVVEIEAQFSLAQLEKISPQLQARIGSLSPSASLNAADVELLAGLRATVVMRSGDLTQRWNGTAVRISESVSERTRTLGVVIQVSNVALVDHHSLDDRNGDEPSSGGTTSAESDQGVFPTMRPLKRQVMEQPPTLRPGSFCEVTLFGRPMMDAITIPRTAIDGDVAYIIDAENRLWARTIEIGNAYGEQVRITAGLNPGDRIAIVCPVPAIDGMKTSGAVELESPQHLSHQPETGHQR